MCEVTAKMVELTNTLKVKLTGSLSSDNAARVEEQVQEYCKQEHRYLVMDLEDLKYSSSAGLRVFLRLCKSEKSSNFGIINVNSDLYEIFEMTGFTEIMHIEKAFRTMSIEGCKMIGKGAKGGVYRIDADTIIKVYLNPESLADIQKERELARAAFVQGIPTAISYDVVKVGDGYGSVFELLDAMSYTKLINCYPEKTEEYGKEFAKLLRQIHTTEVSHPLMADIKKTGMKWADGISSFLDPEVVEKLRRMIDETPDTGTMIHGDFHTNNVLVQNGESLLIDMDTLAYGHPVFELANIYFSYKGQVELDPEGFAHFFDMPIECADVFWDTFIKAYVGTEDPDTLNYVLDRVKILAYARQLRHTVRRIGSDSELGKRTVEFCVPVITELVKKVELLDFLDRIE